VTGRPPIDDRNESVHGLISYAGRLPTLDKLVRDGRASNQRIRAHETIIRRTSKAVLVEWLDQAERLWIAAEIHRLKGKHFEVFAAQIGVDRSSAYELLKLHPHRNAVLTRCAKENRWPGWGCALSWFKDAGDDDNADVGQGDYPISPNRGLLGPTAQRLKTINDEWGTPPALFDHYNQKYNFTLDVAASAALAKCERYFSRRQDGLKQEWLGTCWLNPPYSNRQIAAWCKRAYQSAQDGAVVVALLPAFTEAQWFHDYASHAEIELLKGRLQFVGGTGYSPFAHMVAVWRRKSARRGNQLSITLADHRIGTGRL
jgi:phage N-6-adenine-methyltransferase